MLGGDGSPTDTTAAPAPWQSYDLDDDVWVLDDPPTLDAPVESTPAPVGTDRTPRWVIASGAAMGTVPVSYTHLTLPTILRV